MANTDTHYPVFYLPMIVKVAMKTRSGKRQYEAKASAVKSSLEMTLLLLEDFPNSLEELAEVKTLVNEALMASLRLGLEIKLEDEPLADRNLKLVYSREIAS
jgi:hypothetical protein